MSGAGAQPRAGAHDGRCGAARRAAARAWRCAALATLAPRRAPTSSGRSRWSPRARSAARRPQQAEYAHDAGDLRRRALRRLRRLGRRRHRRVAARPRHRRDRTGRRRRRRAALDQRRRALRQLHQHRRPRARRRQRRRTQTCGCATWNPAAGEPAVHRSPRRVNGSTKGAHLRVRRESAQEDSDFGAVAAGRSAISADGQEVAFVTTAVSNLVAIRRSKKKKRKAKPPSRTRRRCRSRCAICRRDTTARQPLLRQPRSSAPTGGRTGRRRRSATARSTPGPRALGFQPPPADGDCGDDPPPGASISADGSTVAWMGEDIGEQAPMLPGETPRAAVHRAAVAAHRSRARKRRPSG